MVPGLKQKKFTLYSSDRSFNIGCSGTGHTGPLDQPPHIFWTPLSSRGGVGVVTSAESQVKDD